MREFVINENDAGQRIDKFILKTCYQMPKSLMYRLIRQKKIKVNRKRCEPSTMLQENDTIQMFISEDFFAEKEMKLTKAHSLSNIIYEDPNFLILDKQVGIKVHSDSNQDEDTLIQRVWKYLIETGQYDASKENSFTPAFANRLDQNTGGLIIACKNAKSLRSMNEMIRQHDVEKHYMCIIEGKIKDGLYTHYYRKDKKNNKALIYDSSIEKSVPVQLEIKTLDSHQRFSLLDVHLITGKSHQIRAQLAHLGHPLIGDVKYGGRNLMKHQALYAYRLSFHSNDQDFKYLNSLHIEQNNNFVQKKYQEMVR